MLTIILSTNPVSVKFFFAEEKILHCKFWAGQSLSLGKLTHCVQGKKIFLRPDEYNFLNVVEMPFVQNIESSIGF